MFSGGIYLYFIVALWVRYAYQITLEHNTRVGYCIEVVSVRVFLFLNSDTLYLECPGRGRVKSRNEMYNIL